MIFFKFKFFCFFFILVIPFCSHYLPIKLTHNFAFALCLCGDPSSSAFAPTCTSQACGKPAVCSVPHWLSSGFIPQNFPFWILLQFLPSLPRDYALQQLPNKHTQKKCIFSPCLSEIAFHTWWIFELNITQRLKVISPQVREDCSATFLLVVFVCFACCSFCLFYFHWYWRSDDMNPSCLPSTHAWETF